MRKQVKWPEPDADGYIDLSEDIPIVPCKDSKQHKWLTLAEALSRARMADEAIDNEITAECEAVGLNPYDWKRVYTTQHIDEIHKAGYFTFICEHCTFKVVNSPRRVIPQNFFK